MHYNYSVIQQGFTGSGRSKAFLAYEFTITTTGLSERLEKCNILVTAFLAEPSRQPASEQYVCSLK